jgi:hypothetical protein
LSSLQQTVLVDVEDLVTQLLRTEDLDVWERRSRASAAAVAVVLRLAAGVTETLRSDVDADAGQVWEAARIRLGHELPGVQW